VLIFGTFYHSPPLGWRIAYLLIAAGHAVAFCWQIRQHARELKRYETWAEQFVCEIDLTRPQR
jgi:hypothetical protein